MNDNNNEPSGLPDADLSMHMMEMVEEQREHEKNPRPIPTETWEAIKTAYNKGNFAEFNRLHDTTALENFKRNFERTTIWPLQKAMLDAIKS